MLNWNWTVKWQSMNEYENTIPFIIYYRQNAILQFNWFYLKRSLFFVQCKQNSMVKYEMCATWNVQCCGRIVAYLTDIFSSSFFDKKKNPSAYKLYLERCISMENQRNRQNGRHKCFSSSFLFSIHFSMQKYELQWFKWSQRKISSTRIRICMLCTLLCCATNMHMWKRGLKFAYQFSWIYYRISAIHYIHFICGLKSGLQLLFFLEHFHFEAFLLGCFILQIDAKKWMHSDVWW